MAEAVDQLLTGTASAAQVARLLGLSPRRLRELAETGTVPREGGRYRLPDVVTTYCAHLREVAAGRKSESSDGGLDLVEQRARLASAQANLAELKLERERGVLVAVAPLKDQLATMITTVRNKILAVPPLAKGQLPHLSVDDIEALEDMLGEALEALSRDPNLFGANGGTDDHELDDDDEEETE